MISTNRRQHHVPQTHLRNFAEAGTVRVYRFVNGLVRDARIFPTNIRNVAVIHDLYSVTDEHGRDNALDEHLQKIEARIPAILAPVIEGRKLGAEDWRNLKLLTAVQEGRKPGWVKGTTKAIEDLHKIARSLYKQHHPEMMDEAIDAALREKWGDTGLSGAAALDAKNLAIKTVAATLPDLPVYFDDFWSCLVTSAAHDFITSNSPVTYFDPIRKPHAFYGIDRSTREIEITYPLTRRHLLLLARRSLPPYVRAGRVGVSILNSRTVYGSAGEVYGYPHRDRRAALRQRNDVIMPRYGWGVVGMIASDLRPDLFAVAREFGASQAHGYARLLLNTFELGR